VADDFKDFYFAGYKQPYKSFSIESIRYFEQLHSRESLAEH
jgi:hypothetical protein